MSKSRRSQIISDQIVQGELMFRAIVYWFFCLLIIELLVLGWAFLTGPPQTLTMMVRESLGVSAPAAFGMILLLPLILTDVLRVSNRFVGPVQSVRATMRQLSDGVPARRVYLRSDDFWHELAHYTNLVADKIETVDWDDEEVGDLEEADEQEDIPCTDQMLQSEYDEDIAEDELELPSDTVADGLDAEAAEDVEVVSDLELDFEAEEPVFEIEEPDFESIAGDEAEVDVDTNEEEPVEV